MSTEVAKTGLKSLDHDEELAGKPRKHMSEHSLQKLLSWSRKDGNDSSKSGEPLTGAIVANDDIGCETVHEGERDIRADIIFIHGVRGHRRRPWTKNGVFWPKDLLPNQIDSIRVVTYGYDANALVPFGSSSLNNIHHHAKSLVEAVSRIRETREMLPTTTVNTHSMGNAFSCGVVCKDALEYSKEQSGLNKTHYAIFAATQGVVFLGTSHRGSSYSGLAVIAAKAASTAFQKPNVPLLRALKPESEILDRTSEVFTRMLAFKKVDVHFSSEELPMGKFGKITSHMEKAMRFSPPQSLWPYKKTLVTTWELSMPQLTSNAQNLLGVFAFLHHQHISFQLLRQQPDECQIMEVSLYEDKSMPYVDWLLGLTADEDAFDQTIARLESLSLIKLSEEIEISLHRLVHVWAAVRMNPGRQSLRKKEALTILLRKTSCSHDSLRDWNDWCTNATHFRALVETRGFGSMDEVSKDLSPDQRSTLAWVYG
ncbi:hypothetical protein BDR22DRAFT_823588 [Usnea florida]